MHIEIFKGKGSENNRLILEVLAFRGSSIKYDILKEVKGQMSWPTVSRRVDNLKERGYIMKTGKKKIDVAGRNENTPTYGLTWKGLIASSTSDEVRSNIIKVIEKTPQLQIPDLFLTKIKELFTEEEINGMVQKIVEAIKIIPLHLELTNENEILWHLLPALGKVGFQIPEKDWDIFVQTPEVLRFIHNLFIEQEEILIQNLEINRLVRLKIENLMGKTLKDPLSHQ